ncbi:unnamed protein product [Bemisia tabaci]|uniref:Uncharacterized protein n=1 Tax=Bemisia tabaci TaxID=7038 RepID=A0A9P0F3H1_BEMTA|nr:unnamed protein product [Bemisia tabaci]
MITVSSGVSMGKNSVLPWSIIAGLRKTEIRSKKEMWRGGTSDNRFDSSNHLTESEVRTKPPTRTQVGFNDVRPGVGAGGGWGGGAKQHDLQDSGPKELTLMMRSRRNTCRSVFVSALQVH